MFVPEDSWTLLNTFILSYIEQRIKIFIFIFIIIFIISTLYIKLALKLDKLVIGIPVSFEHNGHKNTSIGVFIFDNNTKLIWDVPNFGWAYIGFKIWYAIDILTSDFFAIYFENKMKPGNLNGFDAKI